jgi:hypothetical protein
MRIRSTLAALVAAAAALAMTALPAEAAGPRAISRCSPGGPGGQARVITRDSYLRRDLTCERGFVIASGATLDLRGHTLKGRHDPYACVVAACPDASPEEQPAPAGIVLRDGQVKNGRLDRWGVGVRITPEAPTSGRSRTVARTRITHTYLGLYASENPDVVRVTRSTFSKNGIGLGGDATGGFLIDRSAFVDSSSSGVLLTSSGDTSVSRSEFSDNQDTGFSHYEPAGTSTMVKDVFKRNGYNGLTIGGGDSASDVVVRKNRASRNGGHGMELTTEGGRIVDLGGNRAWRNRTAPQCVGVVCGR